jgi:hypothetical protein
MTAPLDEKSEGVLNNEVLRQVTQSLSSGIAVVDPDSWEILFENARFFKWFPPASDADEPLTQRMSGLNPSRRFPGFKMGVLITLKSK